MPGQPLNQTGCDCLAGEENRFTTFPSLAPDSSERESSRSSRSGRTFMRRATAGSGIAQGVLHQREAVSNDLWLLVRHGPVLDLLDGLTSSLEPNVSGTCLFLRKHAQLTASVDNGSFRDTSAHFEGQEAHPIQVRSSHGDPALGGERLPGHQQSASETVCLHLCHSIAGKHADVQGAMPQLVRYSEAATAC